MRVPNPDYTPGRSSLAGAKGVECSAVRWILARLKPRAPSVKPRGAGVNGARAFRRAERVFIVLSCVGLAASFVVHARSASSQAPVFRTGVDPVTVGVTVTDRRGNLVPDLTALDFELLEDG